MENNKFPNISMGNPNDIRNITKKIQKTAKYFILFKNRI